MLLRCDALAIFFSDSYDQNENCQKTLLEKMQRGHPERYDAALLRTLQRRMHSRGASHGGDYEVFLALAGRMAKRGVRNVVLVLGSKTTVKLPSATID